MGVLKVSLSSMRSIDFLIVMRKLVKIFKKNCEEKVLFELKMSCV